MAEPKHMKGIKRKKYNTKLMTEKEYLDDISGWDDESIFERLSRELSDGMRNMADGLSKIFSNFA